MCAFLAFRQNQVAGHVQSQIINWIVGQSVYARRRKSLIKGPEPANKRSIIEAVEIESILDFARILLFHFGALIAFLMLLCLLHGEYLI